MTGDRVRAKAVDLARLSAVTVIVPVGAGLGGLVGFRFGARAFSGFARVLGWDQAGNAPCFTAAALTAPILIIPLAIALATMVLGALLGGAVGAVAGTALLGRPLRRRRASSAATSEDPAVASTLADLFPARPARQPHRSR